MALRQALAKSQGAAPAALQEGVSGCFTTAPFPRGGSSVKVAEFRGFLSLARAVHNTERSQWSWMWDARPLVSGQRLHRKQKAPRTGPAGRFLVWAVRRRAQLAARL